jgi:CCR4-NOT transcriptional regulation complex NOT5 subunit
MVYGQSNTLKFLHDLGFETFENLFDEKYDTVNTEHVTDDDKLIDGKLKIIINNVKNFEKQQRDLLTQEKIQHNHALFSNQTLVESRFIKEIIEPILEFLE